MKSRAAAVVAAVVVPLVILGVVIVRGGGGGHKPERLPIAASAGGGAAADTSAAELFPVGGITYVAAPGLPSLDGAARAYTLTGNQDRDQVRALADALGLHGDITTEPEGGFTVVDGDAQLTVYPYAGGGWSFVRQSGGGVSSSGTVTSCPEGADCPVPDTTIPPRPANLPSSEGARQLVLDLLGRAGINTSSMAVTVDDLTTQMAVQVDPIVDGIATQGFGTSVTVGDGGAIEYASGTLGHPDAADEYPLIGTAKAIDLLNQGRGFVGPVPLAAAAEAADVPLVEPATVPAIDDASSGETAPGSPGAPLAPCDGTGAPTTFPCTPVTPATTPPAPPPQEITITGAERILLLATSYDGRDSYLVPGYRFTTSSGGTVSVLAIDDSFLAPAPGESQSTKPVPDVTIEPAPSPEPPVTIEPDSGAQGDSGGVSTGG